MSKGDRAVGGTSEGERNETVRDREENLRDAKTEKQCQTVNSGLQRSGRVWETTR